MTDTFYPSKLLLFGEYTVINKSEGLAIPFQKYSGKWGYTENSNDIIKAEDSNRVLNDMIKYLSGHFSDKIDTDLFSNEIKKGLWFDSNIPYGYGLGSSGALCAAVYDRFFKIKTTDNKELLQTLAKIEGFFHGTSSGIDPLVSYLKQPVLIGTDKSISILSDLKPESFKGDIAVFVIDSGGPRKNSGLVNEYLEMAKDKTFEESYIEPVKRYVSDAIISFTGNRKNILEPVSNISKLQYKYMKKMIPPHLLDLWAEGLDTGKFSLKLCGAGGGGFLLGFCNKHEARESLKDYKTVNVLEL